MSTELREKNEGFWTELCGSAMARHIGVTGRTKEDLVEFDRAYMDAYPYFDAYIEESDLEGKRVMEIGLGYGTLSARLFNKAESYQGIDISPGPVAMVNHRIEMAGLGENCNALQASALGLPFKDNSFDEVWSIGCLHHTGNTHDAVDEVYRVLKPSGRAVIMLYNANSFRRKVSHPVMVPLRKLRNKLRGTGPQDADAIVRANYDTNEEGEAAPHTEFVSPKGVREMFKKFSDLKIEPQNMDGWLIPFTPIGIHRKYLLNNIGRKWGLDLYIFATK